ncbi:unnamed protein product, partial [marine sediment metagenome]
ISAEPGKGGRGMLGLAWSYESGNEDLVVITVDRGKNTHHFAYDQGADDWGDTNALNALEHEKGVVEVRADPNGAGMGASTEDAKNDDGEWGYLCASNCKTYTQWTSGTELKDDDTISLNQVHSIVFLDGTVSVGPPNNPPSISGLPEVSDDEDFGTNNSVMDLWDYSSDPEDDDSELTYGINSESDTLVVDCDIYDSHYITCTSQANATGYSDVNVSVTDTGALKDSDVFRFTVDAIN